MTSNACSDSRARLLHMAQEEQPTLVLDGGSMRKLNVLMPWIVFKTPEFWFLMDLFGRGKVPFTMMFLELHDMFVYCDDGVRFTRSNRSILCVLWESRSYIVWLACEREALKGASVPQRRKESCRERLQGMELWFIACKLCKSEASVMSDDETLCQNSEGQSALESDNLDTKKW